MRARVAVGVRARVAVGARASAAAEAKLRGGACTSQPWLKDILLWVKRMVCWSAAEQPKKEGSMCEWCVST